MKKENPGAPQGLTPTVKRERLKDWLARLRIKPFSLLSLARVKNILDKEISEAHRNQIKILLVELGLPPDDESKFYSHLFKQLDSMTRNFILELQFGIDFKERMSPLELRKCRRAFISHHESFKRIAERFPFVMDIGEIDRSYSYIIGILENVIADVGRRQLDRPLMRYIFNLAKVYHEWTGKFAPSTRDMKSSFSQLIMYCIESLGLDKIWPQGDYALQDAINEAIRGFPKFDGKRLL